MLNMRKTIGNKSGFTFVESLITFSIVGIFIALTWATVNFLLLKTNEQIVRTRAHFLAVEGIELVKQIRQTAVNRNRETGFLTSIGSKKGNFVFKKSGDAYQLIEGDNEEIFMNEEPNTTYCRTISLLGDGESIKEVYSSVRWGDVTDCSIGKEIISYSTYLAQTTQ